MDPKTTALLLGGAAPAVIFGVTGFLQKIAGKETGIGVYLVIVGVAATLVGAAITFFERDYSITTTGLVSSAAIGALWALGVAATGAAIRYYSGNVSQLVPIYNMNTLVAVVLGLLLLAEWKTVSPWKISVAAVLIIAGGVLAAMSDAPPPVK